MSTSAVQMKTLEGRKGLVLGIANDQSIAWGCARAFHAFGAELAITYLNERARPHLELLTRKLEGEERRSDDAAELCQALCQLHR